MNQTSLFANLPEPRRNRKESPIALRRRREKEAFASADKKWKERYRVYILEYLEKHGSATAEDIRLAYAASGLPKTHGSERASGRIYVNLRNEGLIRQVGKKRSRLYNNDLDLYERV